MNNSTNYFQEKLDTLPDHVRWAILDVDHLKELVEIKKKYKLHIDQSASLESLAQHLILGDLDAASFMNSLFKEAYISSQTAGDILVDIDVHILRKIREKIEEYEQEERELQEHRDQYKTDEEVEIDEINTLYKKQDEEYVRINDEVREELTKEGIKEDGSNVTDEDIAKAYGMTLAEYLAQNREGAIQEAQKSENNTTISSDILSEKEDLLHELESPEKSFSKPLFEPKQIVKPEMKKAETTSITPDHQLQNTHIEEPFHDDINTAVKPTESVRVVVESKTVTPTTEIKPKVVETTPIIKKPAKIDLGADPYREPIE